MDNVNFDIACNVNKCVHNHNGCNCSLNSIKVGCTCDSEVCTCCESYSEKI
ncbi:MAG: DUF1540 domain-containing protein [Clostridia bacterium]|nr:DUF1540 domain-containing protein [Clostridia bacterium]